MKPPSHPATQDCVDHSASCSVPPAPRHSPPSLAHAAPLLVIADDCSETRWLVRTILSGSYREAIEVPDGRALFWTVEELLAQAHPKVPDILVIADIFMPVYQGIDVLEAWQDIHWPVPVIAITSFPDSALRSRVERTGALLLPKPFTANELQRAVAQVRR